MKKFLLSIMTAVAALTTSYASQPLNAVDLDFSNSDNWKNADGTAVPTKKEDGFCNTESVIKNGSYSITVLATDKAYFLTSGGATVFLIGQKDSYIKLPVFDFQVGTIEVFYSANVAAAQIDFAGGSTEFGQTTTAVKGGSTVFTVPAALSEIGTQYTLKIKNAKNLQIAKIEIKEYAAPEVNAPVISPVSGVYPTAQTVTITADAGCSIYYTLDGTDPSDASTPYTQPFVVSSSTTVKAIAYNEEDCGSAIAESEIVIGYYLYADFLKNQQGWTIDNKKAPSGADVWAFDKKYGMKATGYIGGAVNETESWLVSPAFDLTGATNPIFMISHAIYQFKEAKAEDYISILISENGTDWIALEIENWPTSNAYIDSKLSLESYIGKTVKIALRYTSTAEFAGTYEVKSVKVADESNYVHVANTLETAYTTVEAKSIIDNPNSLLSETVFVKGTVSKIDQLNEDGKLTYWLDDNTFEVYKGLGLEGVAFESKNDIHVGDDVVVKGTISLFNSTTYEFNEGSVLVKLTSNGGEDVKDPTNTPETAYNVARCIEIINAGATVWDLDKPVYLKGVVTFVESCKNNNITFTIRETAASADSLVVYRAKGLEKENVKSKDYVKVGDKVVVYSKITFYAAKSLYETVEGGYIYSLNDIISALDALKEDENAPAEIFNILGQKVESMDSKGIYIVNGKKVIVR